MFIIEEFEGNFAKVELPDGKTVDVPKELLAGFKAGDAFEIKKCDNPYKQKIDDLRKSLFKD